MAISKHLKIYRELNNHFQELDMELIGDYESVSWDFIHNLLWHGKETGKYGVVGQLLIKKRFVDQERLDNSETYIMLSNEEWVVVEYRDLKFGYVYRIIRNYDHLQTEFERMRKLERGRKVLITDPTNKYFMQTAIVRDIANWTEELFYKVQLNRGYQNWTGEIFNISCNKCQII